MKHLLAAALVATPLALASTARAGVFISGSVAGSRTHLFYTETESADGSASIDVELGSYVRIGYSYGTRITKSTEYKDPAAINGTQQDDDGYCQQTCDKTYQNETVISHAVGLTLILYNGELFTPYLLGGAIKKLVTIESLDYDDTGTLVYTPPVSPPTPIGPYAGIGLGIRLSRSFSLKLTYQITPGYVMKPQDSKLYTIWDRQWSVGLQYQL